MTDEQYGGGQDHPDGGRDSEGSRIDRVVDEVMARRRAGNGLTDEQVAALYPDLMPALGDALRRRADEGSAFADIEVEGYEAIRPLSRAPGATVFRATARGTGEPVILRVIEPEALGDEQAVARFERELEMVSRMNPRGAAGIVGHGRTRTGSLYVALEPVAGGGEGGGSRFSVLGPYAWGGVGMISLAMDEDLGRRVAMKELRAELSEVESLRQRFVSEAVVTGQLEHPGVVPIYAIGKNERGQPYYVMKFVEGKTLAKAIEDHHALPEQEKPASLRSLLRRFVSVCQAIGFAHSRGVIHRDIKPQNIMLGDYGETMVLDWGLSKRLDEPGEEDEPGIELNDRAKRERDTGDENVGATLAGEVIGTPGYMAPEQASGRHDMVGVASDVFGLGAMLYAILAGDSPYPTLAGADPVELAKKCEPRAPGERGDVPRALEAICLKAMRKEPAQRYPGALALADEVQRWLDDEPVQECPDTRFERAARWGRHHPARLAAILALIGTTLVAAAVGSLVIGSERVKRRAAEELAEANAKGMARFTTGLNRTRSRAGQLESMAAQAAEAAKQAEADFDAGAAEGRAERLAVRAESARAEADSLEHSLRGARQLADELGLMDAPTGAGVNPAPVTLPRMAFTSLVTAPASLPGLKSWTLDTLTPRGEINGVSISPDSKRVAVAGDDALVRIFDIGTRAQVQLLYGHEAAVTCVAWSPDGSLVASGSEDGTARVFNPGTGLLLATLEGHRASVRSVAWSPDSSRLVTTSYDNTLRIWDVRTRETLRTLVGHTSGVSGVAWAPKSSLIASSGNDLTVRLWDPQTGQQAGKFDKAQAGWTQYSSVRWSHDARYLLWTDNTRTRLWDSHEKIDATQRLPQGTKGTLMSSAFSPDDKSVLGFEASFNVVDLDGGVPVSLMPVGHSVTTRAADWSADGKTIVLGDAQGSVWFADAQARKIDKVLRSACNISTVANWSPNGQLLAVGSTAGTIDLWDLQIPAPIRTIRAPFADTSYSGLVWSPDGRYLAASSFKDTWVQVWDVRLGRLVSAVQGFENGVQSVAWSPGSDVFAVGAADGRVRICKPDDNGVHHVAKTLEGHTHWVRSVSWSPDGRRLASADRAGGVLVWSPDTDAPPRALEGQEAECRHLLWTPDSQTLFVSSFDKTIRSWNVATGRQQLILRGHRDRIRELALKPDGRELLSIGTSGSMRRWQLPWGLLVSTVETPAPGVFSPDSTSVAVATGILMIWDTRSTRLRYVLLPLRGNSYAAISPDGSYVGPPGVEENLVYVAQTEQAQTLLTPAEFASKYKWDNQPVTAVGANAVKRPGDAIATLSIAQGLFRQIESATTVTPRVTDGVVDFQLAPEIRNTTRSPLEVVFEWNLKPTVDYIDNAATLKLSPADVGALLAQAPAWTASPMSGKIIVEPGQAATLDLRAALPAGIGKRFTPPPEVEVRVGQVGIQGTTAKFAMKVDTAPYWRNHLPEIPAHRLDTPPRIDGELDDDAWKRPPDVDRMHRLQVWGVCKPDTFAWTAYDDRNLYVAFNVADDDMPGVTQTHNERDVEIHRDDSVEFFVRTSETDMLSTQHIINTAGVYTDSRTRGRATALQDLSWNGHAQVAVRKHKSEWTVELAIPWSDLDLKGPPEKGSSLRVNFCRNRHRLPSFTHHTWAPCEFSFHELTLHGHLRF